MRQFLYTKPTVMWATWVTLVLSINAVSKAKYQVAGEERTKYRDTTFKVTIEQTHGKQASRRAKASTLQVCPGAHPSLSRSPQGLRVCGGLCELLHQQPMSLCRCPFPLLTATPFLQSFSYFNFCSPFKT